MMLSLYFYISYITNHIVIFIINLYPDPEPHEQYLRAGDRGGGHAREGAGQEERAPQAVGRV